MSGLPTDTAAVGSPNEAQQIAARSDADAIARALAGDRQAFADVALRWQDRIYNAMRKLTGSEHDAADLTQEAFVKALSHLSSFRNESSAYTWLFRIAMNLASSRYRQIGRRRTVQAGQLQTQGAGVFDDRPTDAPSPQQNAEIRERNEQVTAALLRLPQEQRQLLVLRDVEGMEYQQIAQVLSLPLGTLKSRLFRARLVLRDELQSYFDAQEAST